MPTSRGRRADRRVAVGGLITAAIFLALVAVILISGREGILRSHYELRTRMDQVNGLQVGAPVWLAGVNVGSVSDIRFIQSDSTGRTRIEVRMRIKRSVQDLIRDDSRARIGTLGLLGDKYVAISLGSPKGRVLGNGDYIQSTNPIDFEELISRSVGVVDDITAAVHSFKDIAAKISTGKGTIGLLVNDPALYFDLESFFSSVRRVAQMVERNEGTVGRLFNDTTFYSRANATLAELAAFADTLKRGEGSLKLLLRDPALYEKMVDAVERFDSLVAEIRSGKGTAAAIVSDKTLYDNLTKTVATLDSLVQDIRRNPQKYLRVKVSLF